MKTLLSSVALVLIVGFTLPAAAQNAEPEPTQDTRTRAGRIALQMLPPEVANSMAKSPAEKGENPAPEAVVGGELTRIAFENVFVQLWARPGLSPRDRSLATISMLIALGSEEELAIHFAGGIRNGLSREEIEELIYHSSAYAGFPRAAQARAVAETVFAK